MTTAASRNLSAHEYVYTPPVLPGHLSNVYDLKPIVGQPNDEEVKTIHAAIRAVNAEAQIPQLSNPDLSLRLSQHLFSVQMAIYRNTFPLGILPGENTYMPPTLPAHVPITLEAVVGTPSNEQLISAQNVMRVVESRGGGPLFDPELNMRLSQHLFNLQFARYIQESTLGQFTPKPEVSHPLSADVLGQQWEQPASYAIAGARTEGSVVLPLEGTEHNDPMPNITQHSTLEQAESGRCVSSEIVRLGENMKNVEELLGKSNVVLENINRVLIATQRDQTITGDWNGTYIHVNPVNEQGITAVECGLPRLRYLCVQGSYNFNPQLNPAQMAGYLKFFAIGADLIEGDGDPRLRDGRQNEAETLILKHLGLVY